jgi:parvulin-like peptidyl-prolyl isomerase
MCAAAVIVIIGVFSLGCGRSDPSPELVATSDLGQTTRAELDAYIMSQPEGKRKPLPRQDPQDWRREMLRELLTAQALEAEARSSDLAETHEARDLLAARRDTVLAETAEALWIQQHVNITDDDLRTYHENYPEEFGHDEQVRVRHIFLRVDRDAPASERQAVRQEIEALLQQVHDGADFGELAAAHSQSETAALQGLIGKLSRGTLAPVIEDVIWALDEGEVSEIVETPTGFHIFKVDDRLPAEQRSLEEVSGALTRRLTREATEVALANYLNELLEISGALFNPEVILEDRGPDALVFELEDELWTASDWWARFDNQTFFAQREKPLVDQLDRFALSRLAIWDGRYQDLASRPEVAQHLAAVEQATLIELAMKERRRAAVEQISIEDLVAYWESQRRVFQQPKLYELRIITRLFPDDPKLWYGVFEDLRLLAAEIRRGDRDFAEEAVRISDDVSARRGGDVGFVRLDSVGQWAGPNIPKAIAALAEGEVSDPLLIERFIENRFTYGRDGYMLVMLEEVQQPRLLEFDEARDRVVEHYIQTGSPEVNAGIQNEVLDSIHTVIYEANL